MDYNENEALFLTNARWLLPYWSPGVTHYNSKWLENSDDDCVEWRGFLFFSSSSSFSYANGLTPRYDVIIRYVLGSVVRVANK